MTARLRLPTTLAAALLLTGCASMGIDAALRGTNEALPGFTQGQLDLSRTAQQDQRRRQLSAELLARPLTQDAAVQLALANSPGLQALLAQGWADLAAADQAGRIANPLFSFERVRGGGELEIGRLLSIGLLDLLTLPARQDLARNQAAQARVQLGANVVEQVSQVRQAWVRAVAAQELLAYAQQVDESARVSAELAKRLQQVGNFTRLQRLRQHAFHADAAAQLAAAQHAATASREELVRQLGLTEQQSQLLKLPQRLPDLPAQPRPAPEVSAAALQQRLDVQLARLQLQAAGRAQGLNLLNTVADVELGGRRDTLFHPDAGERSSARGFELELRLPLFDWGGAQRAAMNAQSLLAANRHDAVLRAASSQLRESYSAYRTAYDLARHYRNEVVPMRKAISEENVLRYNAMLIGVFELLADQREQVASVVAAIQAQQQFWLAEAGLASTLVGRPVAMDARPLSAGSAAGGDAGH